MLWKPKMKVKTFEVVLHELPSGKSPVTAIEEQINLFLIQHPGIRLVSTHMSSIILPPDPNVMPRREESSIIVFCALFYND